MPCGCEATSDNEEPLAEEMAEEEEEEVLSVDDSDEERAISGWSRTESAVAEATPKRVRNEVPWKVCEQSWVRSVGPRV